MHHPDDILLTKHDLARRWQVSLRTVQRWLRHAPIRPLVMSRGSLRWRLEDVLALELHWQARSVSSLVTPQPPRLPADCRHGPDPSTRS